MAQELSPEEFHKWTDKRTNRNSLFWESERNETHVSQFKSQNPIRRNDKCFCFFLLSDVRFVASSVASEHHWNTTWPNTKPRPTWSLSAWCAASVSRRPTTWTCTCPWCTRWHRLRLRGAAGSSSRHTRTYTPSRWPGRWFSKSKTDDRRKSWFKAEILELWHRTQKQNSNVAQSFILASAVEFSSSVPSHWRSWPS